VIRKEQKIKVAFQGEPGAYSEEAVYSFFRETVNTVGYETLEKVFEVVEKEKVNYDIVPVENSIEGTVRQSYKLFLKFNLRPVREVIHKIKHCLISFPNETLKSVKIVYSHPQALGQCSKFLEKHKYKIIPYYNTAGSIKLIKEKKLKHCAGIASERSARIYGMKILKKGIENNPKNYTRFLIIAKNVETIPTGNDKTSIIFTLKHIPGILFKALRVFAKRNINLTKIESIPIPEKPWEYNFVLEFEGHMRERRIHSALKELKKQVTFLKVIGSYPCGKFSKH